jgi:hypothetical protein
MPLLLILARSKTSVLPIKTLQYKFKRHRLLASPPRGRPSGHLTLAAATLTSPPLAAPLPERAAGCSCGPRGRRRRGSLFSSPADWGGHGCLVLPEASSSALSGWRRRRLGPPDPVFPPAGSGGRATRVAGCAWGRLDAGRRRRPARAAPTAIWRRGCFVFVLWLLVAPAGG